MSAEQNSEVLLISFLGTGNYSETCYSFLGKQQRSKFVVSALAEFLQPDQVILFATKGAREKNLTACMNDLGSNLIVNDVSIGDGGSESDIWQIFERIYDVVPEKAAVWLDITHGFRSLPLLGFLAIAHLKHSKSVIVKGMIYGAFEARDENGITPIFDLSPSLELLDWFSAMDRLRYSGDARAMGDLVIGKHTDMNKAANDSEERPRKLYGAGKSLRMASQAYLVGRPGEYLNQVSRVAHHLTEARDEISKWLPPFQSMAMELGEIYAGFPGDELRGTQRYIRDLMERDLFAQAIPVAQEWMISLAMRWLKLPNGQKGRECAGGAMHQLASPDIYKPRSSDELMVLEKLESTPMAEFIRGNWASLTDFRNDLQHCGHRQNPKPMGKMLGDAQMLLEQVLMCPLPED